MKFTLIFEPKKTCALKDLLGDPDDCANGVYVVKPELSSNLSGVIEGCEIHLPRAGAKPELFILEQKQYGRPPIKLDANNKPIMQDHKNSAGKTVVYPEGHAEGGKPIRVPVYEAKPLQSTLVADANEISVYLNSLKDVFK